jgi:allantoicase
VVCCFDGVPVAFEYGLIGVADEGVFTGACANVSEGWESTAVALGMEGWEYERGNFEKLDFLIKLFSKCCLKGPGEC